MADWVVYAVVVAILVALGLFVRATQARNRRKATRSFDESIERSKELLLTGANTASLPLLDASEYGYRLVGRESLVAVHDDVTKMEFKSTGQYRTGGASVSIPILKGVRYRVSSGSIRSEKAWQPTSRGRLLVTDKAIVFEGDAKNERITWTQVSGIEILLDGYEVSKRSGPPRTYSVSRRNPEFAAIIELLLARTDTSSKVVQ